MPVATPLLVCFMPWADLNEELRVGPVRFVPYAEWMSTVAQDAVTRRFWERYARCHIGMNGKPLTTMAFAVVDGALFGVVDPKHEVYIQRAANAVAFAYLSAGYGSRALPENRRSGNIPIAHVDRFMLYFKSFTPTDRSATITTYGGMSNWSLAQLRIQRPPHVWGGHCVEHDRSLLVGLAAGAVFRGIVNGRIFNTARVARTRNASVSGPA